MDSKHYHENAQRTEAPAMEALRRFLGMPVYQQIKVLRLLHGVLGLASEAGELADQLKRHIFYGKPLDLVNVMEEAGDNAWYLPLIADACGLDFGHMLRANLNKLQQRHGDTYNASSADNRNTALEQLIVGGEMRGGEPVYGGPGSPQSHPPEEDSLDADLSSLREEARKAPDSLECTGCGRTLEGTWLWCPSCCTPVPSRPHPLKNPEQGERFLKASPPSDQHPTLPPMDEWDESRHPRRPAGPTAEDHG